MRKLKKLRSSIEFISTNAQSDEIEAKQMCWKKLFSNGGYIATGTLA